MVGKVPHRWAPSKGSVLFSYLWQKLEFPNGSPAPLRGNLFKRRKDLVFSKFVCKFAMVTEIWKDIEGYENLYQVSSEGRIKNLNYFKTGKEKILKGGKYGSGYLKVKLFKDGKGKNYAIHRLVAQAFIENPDNKPQIDHINTDKTDNRVENLRWVTNKENMNNPITRQNCSKNNYYKGKTGSKHHNSIPIYQLTKEGDIIKKWECAATVAKELNISRIGIRRCCQGKAFTAGGYAWKNVSDYERAS